MNNNLEAILKVHLIDNAAIKAIVGDRIYADITPQLTQAPFVSFYIISTNPRTPFLKGTRNCTTDAIVQIDCWSTSYLQVCNLRNAVCEAVHQMQGDAMLARVTAVRSLTDNEAEDQLFRRSVECQIIYN